MASPVHYAKRLAGRLVRRGKSTALWAIRRSRDTVRLIRGHYPALDHQAAGISYQRVCAPLTEVDLEDRPILHTMDFLPDRLSFSADDFYQCPQATFARQYLEQRNTQNFDYRQTPYYQLAVRGHLPFPCHGKRNATMRCQQFIDLINQLEQTGYQPEKQGAISLAPTCDGRWMVINGKHRLAALHAMGQTKIKVFMGFDNEIRAQFHKVSHDIWPARYHRKSLAALQLLGDPNTAKATPIQELIQYIKNAKLETWADIYHPIPFYEFRNLSLQVQPLVPYQHLQMILDHAAPMAGKRVLDLGCNLGFYALSLAKRGALVTAIDNRKDYHHISTKVCEIYNMPTRFICQSLSPQLIRDIGKVDLTLCLSMIQWVIHQYGMDYGQKILKTISEYSDMLIFEVSVNEGKACLTTTPGEELWYVRQWITQTTTYPHIHLIGQVHPYGNDTRYVFCCSHHPLAIK